MEPQFDVMLPFVPPPHHLYVAPKPSTLPTRINDLSKEVEEVQNTKVKDKSKCLSASSGGSVVKNVVKDVVKDIIQLLRSKEVKEKKKDPQKRKRSEGDKAGSTLVKKIKSDKQARSTTSHSSVQARAAAKSTGKVLSKDWKKQHADMGLIWDRKNQAYAARGISASLPNYNAIQLPMSWETMEPSTLVDCLDIPPSARQKLQAVLEGKRRAVLLVKERSTGLPRTVPLKVESALVLPNSWMEMELEEIGAELGLNLEQVGALEQESKLSQGKHKRLLKGWAEVLEARVK